jgi:hypothetical protein
MYPPILAILMLEFTSVEQCQGAVEKLMPIIHHGIHVPCTLHNETFAFYLEHFDRHVNVSEIPPSRPKELQ